MIDAIRNQGISIAKRSLEEQTDALVVQVAEQKATERYVVILNFNIDNNSLSLDLEPLTKESAYTYFHIGTADGPNSEQWMLTGTRPDYIISQSIYALVKIIPCKDWKEKLQKVQDLFFYDTGNKKGSKERYRYVFDIKHLKSRMTMEELIKKVDGNEKKIISRVAKEVNQAVEEQFQVRAKDIALWVLSINSEFPQQSNGYRQLAWQLKEKAFEKITEGICSLCNSKTNVTSDTTKLRFKSYITDKLNFSSGISKKFSRNFQLCQTCHRQLILGEMRIMSQYNARIGRLSLYIIPEFLFDYEGKYAYEWGHNAVNQGKAIINMKQANEMGIKLMKDLLNDINNRKVANQFTLQFLFYLRQQKEFRVIKLIKDVAPSKLTKLQQTTAKIKDFTKKYFQSWGDQERIELNNDFWNIDFQQIYWLFPLKEKQGQITEYRKLLQLYDAILTGKPVERKFVIQKLLELAKIYYYEQTNSYQLSAPKNKDFAMIIGLLKGTLLLKYLELADVLKGGEPMDVSQLQVQNELKEFISEIGYGECETSLVLLGFLIHHIAREQYKELGSKPILDKINYQGMNTTKLQRLGNDVFVKLKQYKLIQSKYAVFYEKIYSDFKMLLDKNISKWQLSDQENAYYVLSGYALATRRLGKKNNEEN